MSEFFLTLPGGIMDDLKAEVLAIATKVPDEFKNLGHAVGVTAYEAKDLYEGYLADQPIPGRGQLKKPAILKGQTICRPLSALAWAIGHEDDAAKRIEEGSPAHDMKQDLRKAPKARRSKDGSLYLIIPFRHSNPKARGIQAMPKEVYKLAKAMSFSHHQGVIGSRMSATGHSVPLFGYQWGDRLGKGLAPKAKSWHVTDYYQGMYRFHDAGTTKQQKSAGYITFRTMSQKSDPRSWIRPAQPGLFPLDTAMTEAWNANVPFLDAALWEDIQVMWAGIKS
jgi:hypothetical protein